MKSIRTALVLCLRGASVRVERNTVLPCQSSRTSQSSEEKKQIDHLIIGIYCTCFVHWLSTVLCLEIDALCFLIHIYHSNVKLLKAVRHCNENMKISQLLVPSLSTENQIYQHWTPPHFPNLDFNGASN